MDFSLRDFRYAWRSVRHSPTFTLATVAVLGLGIGANTAIFSVVYSVLLRSLPYPQANRIQVLRTHDRDRLHEQVSYATYLDWKGRTASLEHVAAYRGWLPTLTGQGEPAYLEGMLVTSEFFRVLGAQVQAGRDFTGTDDRPGTSAVVIVSEGLWQRRFGSDPQLIGKAILLDHRPYTIIGILPDRFRPTGSDVLNRPEIFAPLAYDPTFSFACRTCEHLWAMARLKPGITPARAAADLNRVQQQLDREYPQAYAQGTGVEFRSLQEEFTGKSRALLLALAGAVGLLLLIACVNVANLFLVRTTARRKEVALRVALGAGRGRIVRQLLAESLTIGLLGGATGLLLAGWGTQVLAALGTARIPRLDQAGVNGPVLGFALLLSLATGALFGLAPALEVSREDLHDSLKEGGRSGEGQGRKRLRDLLVIGELAMALVLVTGAGLLTKSFLRLSSVAPGFDARRVLTVSLDVFGSKYETGRQVPSFYHTVLERVRAVPGVESAGAVNILPIGGSFDRYRVCIDGQADCFGPEAPSVDQFIATPGYFPSLRIPLRRGRVFSDHDRTDGQPVVVIGEMLARRLWPGQDALGKRLQVSDSPVWRTVVGVVGDVRLYGLDVAPSLEIYIPHMQHPQTFMNLVVRSAGMDAAALGPQVTAQVSAVEKDQPIFRVATMEQIVAGSMAERRFALWLTGGFAIVALLLAAVGVYGVIAYSAARRTREIGIRMALGARSSDVFRMVLGHAAVLTAGGIAAGTLCALALNRLLTSLLFGVSPADPAVFGGVALLLTAIALAASYLPARRACRVDPLSALRHE